MASINHLFYAWLKLRFPDVEANPGSSRPVPGVSIVMCSDVWGLSRNLGLWFLVTVASFQHDLSLGSETLVSDRCFWR